MPMRPRSGAAVGRTPEEVMVELLGRGLLERGDLAALRVHPGHDVLDGAVLAGGVHGLEDHEERLRCRRPRGAPAPGRSPARDCSRSSSARFLPALPLRWASALPPFQLGSRSGQVGRAARLDQQPVQDGAGDRHGLLPECGWIGGWVGGSSTPGCGSRARRPGRAGGTRRRGPRPGSDHRALSPRSDRVVPWCAYGRRGVFRVARSGPAGLRPGDSGGRAGGGSAAVVAGRAGAWRASPLPCASRSWSRPRPAAATPGACRPRWSIGRRWSPRSSTRPMAGGWPMAR